MVLRFYKGGPRATKSDVFGGAPYWCANQSDTHQYAGCDVARSVGAVIPRSAYKRCTTAILPLEF